MRPIRAAVLGLALVTLQACSLASSPSVAREDLAEQIARGEAPLVLDVRSDSEFTEGHVPGAVHIPFRSVDERSAELPVDKDDPIVVTCQHGPRAVWAARSLRKAGYTNVSFLDGHMSAWTAAGLPTETSAAPPEEAR